jgi:hypothetical protein
MPLIGAEAAAATLVAWGAAAILAAYAADRLGLTIAPLAILPISLACASGVWLRLRRRATPDRSAAAAFAAIVAVTFGWLMWRARPDFLPTGTGSDLAHHLALLSYVERHWRLVHEAAVGAYLGEMIDYTPGAHLLTVLAGAWLRSDALHVLHGVVSLTVAIKCGLVFLIARRLMPDRVPRLPFAIAASLLPCLPYTFFAGSFMEQSFMSQTVSELFAIAMWWTIVVWRERPAADAVLLFALFGVATFLTWPVWLGPLALTLAAVLLVCREIDWPARLRHLAIALAPIAIVTVVYTSGRQVYGFDMVHAVGFAVWPTPQSVGWPFIVLALCGWSASALDRRARVAAVLVAAIVVQAAALAVTGRSSGASAPYLSLKMAYLAIYPLSVAAAVMLATVWRALVAPAAAVRYAWLVPMIVALGVGRSLATAPSVTPVVTQPVFLAGAWALAHVPPACVDYLVADGYTGYWLHLAVLGNPRAAGRTLVDDTFEPRQAIVRWIVPDGLPYAITDNLEGLPRDIRTNVDILARFGPAAVVKRRGPSSCDDHK